MLSIENGGEQYSSALLKTKQLFFHLVFQFSPNSYVWVQNNLTVQLKVYIKVYIYKYILLIISIVFVQ